MPTPSKSTTRVQNYRDNLKFWGMVRLELVVFKEDKDRIMAFAKKLVEARARKLARDIKNG